MKVRLKHWFLSSISLILTLVLLISSTVVSITSFALSADTMNDYHNSLNYTVPVLTTDTVTGNTIFSLSKEKQDHGSGFTSDPYNLDGNTGIHYEWVAGAGSGVRNGIDKKFGFEGASVKIANVGDTSNPGSRRFAIYFTTNKQGAYNGQKNGVLRIKFDGVQNKVFADLDGSSYTVMTNSEIFAAMPNNTVYVDINKAQNETDYTLIVTAGDKVASGTIPASHITGFTPDSDGKCYVVVAAVNISGQKATTLDFLGVGCAWQDIELNDSRLYYHGRTFDVDNGIGIDWSHSGIAMNVKASQVKMALKAQNGSNATQGNRSYVQVYINGEKSQKILLKDGQHYYDIATDLNPDEVTEIKVLKVTEANFSYVDLKKISVRGSVEPIDRKVKKIEVIGDSISAGYGIISEANATGFKAVEEDSTYTYAALLAKKLDAELTLLASSGSGIFMDSSGLKSGESKNNKAANVWTDMYDYSVVARGQRGMALSTSKKWDFTNDHPDIILVNLGTNDAANVAKLSQDDLNNGVAQAVNSFLTKLTTTHPNAKIVWCYGLMNNKLAKVIEDAVDSFAETNDKVFFIELPRQYEFSDVTGADSHPNAVTHQKVADYIYKELAILGQPEKHTKIDYTVPVLTTDTVTGNTIYTLEQSKKNWSKFFVSDPSNLENNTGIHYEWTYEAGNGVSNGIDKEFKFEGSSVKLANVGNSENVGSKRFEIIYTGNRDVNYTTSNGALRIGFNGRLGYAVASVNGNNINILGNATATVTDVKNPTFKNISDKTVYVDIAKKADTEGDYIITLKIGNIELSDTIPASLLQGLNFDPSGKCYIGLSAYNITGQQTASIDFLGVGSNAEIEDTIALIEKIGAVDLTNGAPIKEARAAYESLTENGKKLVPNYQTLIDAEKEYVKLSNEADSNLYKASYHTAHLSNQLDAKNVMKTIQKDWAPYFWVEDVSTGGLRYNYTGAGSNIREGFSRFVSIDGLYIQFDNLVRKSSDSGVFALVFGSAEDYIGSYTNENGASNAFVIVFDTVNGKVYALSNGEHTIITDDRIKYENIKQRRFSVSLKEENHIYTLTVDVNGEKIKGTFSGGLFENSAALKNPNKCRFAISSWTSRQYFSLDLLGVGKDEKVDAVEKLINQIGIVTVDSQEIIEKATLAYEKLSDNEKERVENYSALISAEAYLAKLRPESAVENVINYIDEIGDVTIYSEVAITTAEKAYIALSDQQKKAVTNAKKLDKALKEYYKLISPHLYMDQYAYSPLNTGSMYSIGTNYNDDSSWDGRINFGRLENGVLRLTWKEARRDMCQGVNTLQNLDGMRLQLQNLTADEGKNGTQLAILLSPTSPAQYYSGGKSMAVVLDSENGEIRSYPGGHLVMKDDILKHNNVKENTIYMWFSKITGGVIHLCVAIGTDTVSGVISAESMGNIFAESTDCYFSLSPWVECSDDLRDNSTHSFSVDIVSVYTAKINGQKDTYVFQSVLKLNELIDALPNETTDSNSIESRKLLNEYRCLNKKLKPLITSFQRLDKLLSEIFEKESFDKYGKDIPVAES